MFKLLTAAFLLSTLFTASSAFADENSIFPGQLSTKGLVRMSLWYEGLDSSQNSENQQVTKPQLSEELERALLEAN